MNSIVEDPLILPELTATNRKKIFLKGYHYGYGSNILANNLSLGNVHPNMADIIILEK